MGDIQRVRQIMSNLLSNAVKFTPAGSVTIRARLVQPGEQVAGMPAGASFPAVMIAVQDTGIGIAPEHHELIFEEFQQVDNSYTRQYEGTGLGLAIVRRLVAAMGGVIWLDSAAGKGSSFYFTLPLAGEGSSG
jgi:signal transduction histidine kinase